MVINKLLCNSLKCTFVIHVVHTPVRLLRLNWIDGIWLHLQSSAICEYIIVSVWHMNYRPGNPNGFFFCFRLLFIERYSFISQFSCNGKYAWWAFWHFIRWTRVQMHRIVYNRRFSIISSVLTSYVPSFGSEYFDKSSWVQGDCMSTNSGIIEFEFVAGRGYRRNFAQNELPEPIHMQRISCANRYLTSRLTSKPVGERRTEQSGATAYSNFIALNRTRCWDASTNEFHCMFALNFLLLSQVVWLSLSLQMPLYLSGWLHTACNNIHTRIRSEMDRKFVLCVCTFVYQTFVTRSRNKEFWL